MTAYGYKYEMEYVMSYIAMLDQPQVIGPVAEGLRLNFNVTGGTVGGRRSKESSFRLGLTGSRCAPTALAFWTCEPPSRLTTMP